MLDVVGAVVRRDLRAGIGRRFARVRPPASEHARRPKSGRAGRPAPADGHRSRRDAAPSAPVRAWPAEDIRNRAGTPVRPRRICRSAPASTPRSRRPGSRFLLEAVAGIREPHRVDAVFGVVRRKQITALLEVEILRPAMMRSIAGDEQVMTAEAMIVGHQ